MYGEKAGGPYRRDRCRSNDSRVSGAGIVAAGVLAEKRRAAIEEFIRDHLSFENGEVVQLHTQASVRRSDRLASSKTAA
jgi:hypothetical protein